MVEEVQPITLRGAAGIVETDVEEENSSAGTEEE